MKGQLGGRFQAPLGGRGRMPFGKGMGIGGFCVCRNCGYRAIHRTAYPCYLMRCPKCGTVLSRE